MTVTEERLVELLEMDVPRASLAVLTIEGLDEMPAEVKEAIDQQFSHYAWLTDDQGVMLCPGCNSRGFFGWGLQHGAGHCSCGWPGRLYHFIADPDPNAACRSCGKPPDTHYGDILQCKDGDVFDTYRAKHAARVETLLWAHPSEVVQTKKGG